MRHPRSLPAEERIPPARSADAPRIRGPTDTPGRPGTHLRWGFEPVAEGPRLRPPQRRSRLHAVRIGPGRPSYPDSLRGRKRKPVRPEQGPRQYRRSGGMPAAHVDTREGESLFRPAFLAVPRRINPTLCRKEVRSTPRRRVRGPVVSSARRALASVWRATPYRSSPSLRRRSPTVTSSSSTWDGSTATSFPPRSPPSPTDPRSISSTRSRTTTGARSFPNRSRRWTVSRSTSR